MKQVVIVAASCRFPEVDESTFRPALLNGQNFITQADSRRWTHEEFLHPSKANPGTAYTFAAGTLGDISGFDAGFFNISPREAASMDPQQRLLLEMVWELFENAGIKPSALRGSDCGVYLGVASVDHGYRLAQDMAAIDAGSATGNAGSIVANRLSYFYDLRGPSMTVDTACSSSLVAFHQACHAIRNGEISQAVAGGISLHLHPFGFLVFSKASMLSRSGQCRPFDESADGYVRSEGGGVFLLKEYEQALADGNRILAFVAGSALNTDGHKSSLTLPSAESQITLMQSVYARAGIAPDQIDYLEAHGTGTPVGDPIEARAIGEALGVGRSRPLPIGSVKSNLGHLEAASGVAGLAKALLCLMHREIPATSGITRLNPNIPFADLNLEVVTRNRALKPDGELIVGINSFGFGGTNAHVILRSAEPDAPGETPALTSTVPLMLSAKDEDALAASAHLHAAHLNEHGQDFYDTAYHALLRRDQHLRRLVVVTNDARDAAQALADFAIDPLSANAASVLETGTALDAVSDPVWVFSGNGSQWSGMGRALLADPVFRGAVAEVDQHFEPMAGYSLLAELAGENGNERYAMTEIAQPALFAVQVGLVRMLEQRGLRPQAVIGHSVGEVAAAWACGALSLAQATLVIYQRSFLQGLTRGDGQMSAVGLGGAQTMELLKELGLASDIVVAGENSSNGSTVAGPILALSLLEKALGERQIFVRRLALDYAFHSPSMEPIHNAVLEKLASIRPQQSRVPFYSTVTGSQLCGEQLDAGYWWLNIRQPVRFHAAMQALVEADCNVFVEVGPHPILRSYVADALAGRGANSLVLPTLLRNDERSNPLDRTLARLIIAGVTPRWDALFPHPGRWLRLPNYPWQRERHWHAVTAESGGLLIREREHSLLGYRLPNLALHWENRLDTILFPTLADHRVGDAVLFPGAGFAELALAAALLYQPGDFVDIEELEILTPLILTAEHSKKVRVIIDESDGGVSIVSRTTGASEKWLKHAVARFPGEAGGFLLQRRAPELPVRAADFNAEQHLQLTRAAGLNYGPAYQAVECGWWVEGGILARLRVPSVIEAEISGMHLHPALLDSAFQLITQLLARDPNRRGGLAFIPVKLGRITFATQAGVPTLAQVRELKSSRHSLLADFTLYDEAGRAVVHITNARFRGVRLQPDRRDDIKCIAMPGIAKPYAGASVGSNTTPVSLHAALLSGFGQSVLQADYVNTVDPLLESLCSRFFSEAVEHFGGLISPAMATLWKRRAPALRLFIDRLLEQGLEDGSLGHTDEGGWVLATPSDEFNALSIWQELLRSYPEYFQLIHSVGRIGRHLPALLSGEFRLGELLPAETSPAILARLAQGAAANRALLGALQSHIAERLHALPSGQRLSILELGMGDRALAHQLCVGLDFDRVDYLYCAEELAAVELLQADYPDLEAVLFPDARQNSAYSDRYFDLVLLPGDLAPVKQVDQALQFASRRLRNDAQLLLVAQHPARWADFVFAAESEWWLEVPGQPALGAQQRPGFWTEQLGRYGLLCQAPVELAPGSAAGSYMLVATPPSQQRALNVIPAQQWVLVASADGPEAALTQALVSQLLAAGQQVTVLVPQALTQIAAPQQIVLLAGLYSEDGLSGQTGRCMLAAQLLQLCEARGITCSVWLLTHGAARHLLPDMPALPVHEIADAAFWGFGRTLINEYPRHKVCLLDLPGAIDAERVAAVLLAQDTENEIALNAVGQRFVPRLRILPDNLEAGTSTPASSQVRLGFDMPGQLRNLRWETCEPLKPASDELEIEVQATGLNFRDVMYTLGMLADEAIENGFSGPTLGFEFAGVVRTRGDQVHEGFLPGDRVVGFGPCSFANTVVTQANAVARIPHGMSFEAAATIPSTFFTVYYALNYLARLEPGETILIHGAAGGVGLAAVQIAKSCGARIFATAGSDEKRDFLRMLGVDQVFDSRSLAYADQILALTGGVGIDVVLNSLAGEAINRNFNILKPFGRFLELGKRDFYQNTKVGLRPFRNNISYFGVDADQLMSERPELTRRLFTQMMDLFAQGVLSPLPYHEFDANEIVEAFRYMQQARQIGKVVVTYRNPIQNPVQNVACPAADRPAALQLDGAGTYLVTGGLGGFGLRTAQWLVAKGARHLVLLSRRGAHSAEAQPLLAAWSEQGIDVQPLACDITDRQALAHVFEALDKGAYPLRGVVHAATVIDDSLIHNLNAQRFERVLGAKALGAQYLDELTRELSLDFFVLFSSATTLFGNPGQGNYVAANHWVEALGRNRRAMGLPATVVQWGAIDDVGLLARNQATKEALQHRMGGAALQASVALDYLEQMLLQGRSAVAILELDWNALSRFLPSAQAPRFIELARVHSREQSDDSAMDVQQLLREMDNTQLIPVIAEMLKQQISEILRLPADRLNTARALQELGLDSLMSVELVVAVEERFGIRLPVMELGESSTIDKLTLRVIDLLRSGQTSGEQDLQDVARDTLARHGLQLSSEDAACLLDGGLIATPLIN